jgi:hypothetical protein
MRIKPQGVRAGIIGVALVAGIVAGSLGFEPAIASTLLSKSLATNTGEILTPSLRPGESNQSRPPAPVFPRNEDGQTYGSSTDGTPDLISAVGVDGTSGYVRSVELMGELPKTPEEAIAQQNKRNAAGNVRKVPLYAVDGKTIIGVFNVGN